jgi:hypothetical protein
MVDVDNSYTALARSGEQLSATLALQNHLLSDGLSNDCNIFGVNNTCVAVSGGYARTSGANASVSNVTLRAARRFMPQVRVGIFLDQGLDGSLPSNYRLKSSKPMFGAFTAWNAQDDGFGAEVKASFAFSEFNTKIARAQLANTEAGKGESSIEGRGARVQGLYGIAVSDIWLAKPFVEIEYTEMNRDGYTEASGAEFAMTYQDVKSSAATLSLGSEFVGEISSGLKVVMVPAIEQDITRSTDDYTAYAPYFGSYVLRHDGARKIRRLASVGLEYSTLDSGTFSFNASAADQTFEKSVDYSVSLSYSQGF